MKIGRPQTCFVWPVCFLSGKFHKTGYQASPEKSKDLATSPQVFSCNLERALTGHFPSRLTQNTCLLVSGFPTCVSYLQPAREGENPAPLCSGTLSVSSSKQE